MNEKYFILVLLILIPFLPYMWKIIFVDKVFCPWWFGDTCSTDRLGDFLEGILLSIVALLTLKRT